MKCASCGKEITFDNAMRCAFCGRDYCPECAESMGVCECYGDFDFYN